MFWTMCRATSRLASRTHFWELVGAHWSFWGPLGHLLGSSSAPLGPLESSVSTLGQHLALSYRLLGALGPPLASQEGPEAEAAHKASQNTQGLILRIFNVSFEYTYTNSVYTRN